ncbi:hypothetical protein FD724_02320 [Nostoc sp. C057]|uniref:hypothetical protein n=1 Tax=Nostoc sp. C057 TaxID=2576903 RepID=UPI0015C30CC3|nr:hypothetical protein [Nostoc sp. C057]QLE47081.1 hypothetical protein FD724_02320 [Nostoc sp. C057]
MALTCSNLSLDIAPRQKQPKSEYIYPQSDSLSDRKSLSPNNEVFKMLTSALSVVVTESQMVAQASRVVAAGIQTNADLFPEPHNQPNCNPL